MEIQVCSSKERNRQVLRRFTHRGTSMLFTDMRPNEESVERRPKTKCGDEEQETSKGDFSGGAATRGQDNQDTAMSQKPGAQKISRRKERSSVSNTADRSCKRELAG